MGILREVEIKKIFILTILILVLILTKYSSAQTGLKLSQTQSDAQHGELVKVSSGSYRNILSEQLWTIASETLVKLGYTNVWDLNDGMIEWKKKGFPLLNKSKN